MIKLYHTYQQKLIPFKPLKKGKVKMYNCGPTVYDFLTIGNLRAYSFNDFLRRTLEYLGYEVSQVMNITDVGHLTMTEAQKKSAELQGEIVELTDTDEGLDRMTKAAKREGLSVLEIADKYTDIIFGKNWKKNKEIREDGDLGKMNMLKPHHLPKASEYIKEQIEIIKKLEEKGFTYKTKEAVYFDIKKFEEYENIVGQSFDEMKKGSRANTTDKDRKHPADFRLWQLNQPDHPLLWDSPWGKGYPGWHIECSAMSKSLLGQPIDIHTGGEDLVKTHHPAEMAQSESAYDKPMANYWMHNAFLTVDGRRMGKSVGNAYTLKDIENYSIKHKGVVVDTKGELHLNSLALRYLYLTAHYRTKQDFTWKVFERARISLGKIIDKVKEYKQSGPGKILKKYQKEFLYSIEDDINTPKALAVFWNLLRSDEDKGDKLATMMDFDKVFGLRLDEIIVEAVPEEVKKLLKKREEARKKKDWDKADKARDEIIKKYRGRVEEDVTGASVWYPS